MSRQEGETVVVADDADVILAGRQTKSMLTELEFDESATDDVVLVVHELASNIVKHAEEGSITLMPESENGRCGIGIRARDSGPGIADVNQAVVDGYSTKGSIGGGLGTVHRLMDDVVINSRGDPEKGVEIVANRWNDASPSGHRSSPFEVGAATKAKPGHEKNGDTFLIKHRLGETLVGVIDGLGHGEPAHHASSKAEQYVRANSTEPLTDLFDGVERVCRDTRGVVMLLARLDWDAATVTLGSVGNITLRVCHSAESLHLAPERGVLGGNAPNPVITEWDWDPASVMVVHSDGLPSHWSCDEFSLDDGGSVTDTATELLRTLWDQDDDATVLVIKEGNE